MPRKLLLAIVVLALLSISYGLPQEREKRSSSLDDALDVEAGHWKKWCTDIIQPEDLDNVTTILVNHRLDVKALRHLTAVLLVSTGIKLGDAQRLLAKANTTAPLATSDSSATNATTADNSTATTAPQPVIVITVTVPTNQSNATVATSVTNQTSSADVIQTTPYQSIAIQPLVVAPIYKEASRLNAETTTQLLDWVTFLRGLVSDNDLFAVASRLVDHRLSPADLPLVSSTDLISLGLTLGDAVRILAKYYDTVAAAQTLAEAANTTTTTANATAAVNNATVAAGNTTESAAKRSFRKRVTPIDTDWIDDTVVDPKDIDLILAVFLANHITTVEDLINLAVGDLVKLGLALGDASRIVKKAKESVPASTDSATATTNNATASASNATSVNATNAVIPSAAIKITVATVGADSAVTKHISIEMTMPVNITASNVTAANATASNSNSTVNATSGPPQATIGIQVPIIANNNTNGTQNTNGTVGVPVNSLSGPNAPVFTVTPVETPVVTVAAHPITSSKRRQVQQQQHRGKPQARPVNYKAPASQGRRRSL